MAKITEPDLSVVILCYRTGYALRGFVTRTVEVLRSCGITDFELVLVGNYHKNSDDSTPRVVKELAAADMRIKAIAEVKQGMMGSDMRMGLAAATGKYIAVIDGDGQMPVEDIVRVRAEMGDGRYDIVKTYRITRGDSRWRMFISFIYNMVFRILFPGLGSRDVNAKPKIIRHDKYALLDLRQDDWFLDGEIMIQARRHRFRIKEIPTTFLDLGGSRKSFVRAPAIIEFIKNLIVFRIREFTKQR